MGECLGWCVSMAAWREGFVSSGCSEDDNNTNYSRHSLSMQSVLPVAIVPFSIHRKSDVTSSGYKSQRQEEEEDALPCHTLGVISLSLCLEG